MPLKPKHYDFNITSTKHLRPASKQLKSTNDTNQILVHTFLEGFYFVPLFTHLWAFCGMTLEICCTRKNPVNMIRVCTDWWQKITENIKILLTQRPYSQSVFFLLPTHSTVCTEDEFSSLGLSIFLLRTHTLHLCDTMRSPTTAQSFTSKQQRHLGSTKGFIEDF